MSMPTHSSYKNLSPPHDASATSLQWLPTPLRIKLKLLNMTFKVLTPPRPAPRQHLSRLHAYPPDFFFLACAVLVFTSEPLQRLLLLPGTPSPWVRGNCIDNPCLPNPSCCASSQLRASAGPSVFYRQKASQSLPWDEEGYAGPCCEIPWNLPRDTLGASRIYVPCL